MKDELSGATVLYPHAPPLLTISTQTTGGLLFSGVQNWNHILQGGTSTDTFGVCTGLWWWPGTSNDVLAGGHGLTLISTITQLAPVRLLT